MTEAAPFWRGFTKRIVEIADSWIMTGEWWEGEKPFTVFRVLTEDLGLYELTRTHTDPPQWKLLVIWD